MLEVPCIHLSVQRNNCKTKWRLFRGPHALHFSISHHSGQSGRQTAQVWDQRHDGSDGWPGHLWNSQRNLEHRRVGQRLWPQHGWRPAAGNSRWAVDVCVCVSDSLRAPVADAARRCIQRRRPSSVNGLIEGNVGTWWCEVKIASSGFSSQPWEHHSHDRTPQCEHIAY